MLLTKMKKTYYRDGAEGMDIWYASLSEEERARLFEEWRQACVDTVVVFDGFRRAIAAMVPLVVEAFKLLTDLLDPVEFERLARKERSRKRYERMMGRKLDG